MSMQKFNRAVVDQDEQVVGRVDQFVAKVKKTEPGYTPPVHRTMLGALGRQAGPTMQDTVTWRDPDSE